MKTDESDNSVLGGSPLLSPRFAELRALAERQLGRPVFDYIDSAAGEERTAEYNEKDLDRLRFRPLCLRSVGSPQIATSLLGYGIDAPLGFSPTAFHRMVCPEGEIATARAAYELNVPMIVSSMSSIPLEAIAKESRHPCLWFQTYLFADRGVTRELIRRAKDANYKAIVLTIGCPVPGLRYRNIRNQFTLPDGITAANFQRNATTVHNNPIHSFRGAELDPDATWSDIEWLRQQSNLPIVVKGLINPVDVAPAIASGVAGLIVSNHGGRQLDGTDSTIAVLPEIASAVDRRISVAIDSGFRNGTDVLKALTLGADAVFLGRLVMWALASNGAPGVILAFRQLLVELKLSMQLLGCRSITDLRSNPTVVVRAEGHS